MATDGAVKVKAVLLIADLFSDDYVRKHLKNAVESIYNPVEGEAQYFIGFTGDSQKNLWTEFAHVGVDVQTGEARFLDYRLPSGFRMKNPIVPVRCA